MGVSPAEAFGPLAANNELPGLPSINDVEGRETVIAMFKVALGQQSVRWW